MRIFDIIKKTVLTEKTYKQMEGKRKFVFEVAKDSTKHEIKYAFEKLFEIKVEAINTKNLDGKPKTMGKYTGRKNHRKIAIITVKPSQNLDILTQDENNDPKTNDVIKEKITDKNIKDAIIAEPINELEAKPIDSKNTSKKLKETKKATKSSKKVVVDNKESE